MAIAAREAMGADKIEAIAEKAITRAKRYSLAKWLVLPLRLPNPDFRRELPRAGLIGLTLPIMPTRMFMSVLRVSI